MRAPPALARWLDYLNAAEMQEYNNWQRFMQTNPDGLEMPEWMLAALDGKFGGDSSWLLDLWKDELCESNPERTLLILRDWRQVKARIAATEALR